MRKIRVNGEMSGLVPGEDLQVLLLDWRQGLPKQDLYRSWLGDFERERWEALKNSSLRSAYACSHGLLREALGILLGKSPAAVSFVRNSFGKPGLACGSVQFSLSHSENLLAAAFSGREDVGVDVECVREAPGLRDIAGSFFSPAEARLLEGCGSEEAFRRGFYKIWTAKEAVVKCLGTGFACEVGEIDTAGDSRWDLAARESFSRTVFRDLAFSVAVIEPADPGCVLSVAARERQGGRSPGKTGRPS